jgi:tetratricopeptide (TPR) repeat protein
VLRRRFLLAVAILELSAPLARASAACAPAQFAAGVNRNEPPRATAAADATEPADAAGFSRRGNAFASRGDFVHAIADFTRACELAPTQPEYFYQRAMARWANGQPVLALEDFDQTLKLRPGHVPALISRAELRLVFRDSNGAAADLDLAARSAPKQSDVRMTLGDLYTRIGRFAPAVAQYDLWIAAHPESTQTPAALKARCWARALWGKDLKRALSDCNTALRLRADTPGALDSRGLVELRLGQFAQAIRDYNAALESQPKNAWLLYARGVAELRSGRGATGRADIGAAAALQPQILDVGRQRGLIP